MIDRIGAAHRRADCALNYAAAIVLTGLVVLGRVDPHTSYQPPSPAAPPVRIAVAPPRVFVAAADEDQSECLAEVLYYEARGEGTEGEKAVAEVVLQRTRDRNYPGTICGVVYEGVQPHNRGCQFSFACDGALRQPKERTTWERVRRLADAIVSGAVKLAAETQHAIAYHSVDVEPAWAGTMLKTAQIGNHIFYRRDPQALLRMGETSALNDGSAIPDVDARSDAAPTPPPAGSQEIQSQVQITDTVSQGA